MMRTIPVGAVIAGFIAAPAMAAEPAGLPPAVVIAPGPQGYLGIAGGGIFGDGDSAGALGVNGALNVPMGTFNVEIEGRGAILWEGGSSIGYSMGMVHGFHRLANSAWGVYGGFEGLEAGLWTIGAEAQHYLGAFSLYGQVAWQAVNGGSSGWYVRGSVQFFHTDNFVLQGDLKFLSIEGESLTTVGITAEKRFEMSPWSIYANVRNSSGDGESITVGLVGIRAHIGNRTLRQQYTTGASMNTMPLL